MAEPVTLEYLAEQMERLLAELQATRDGIRSSRNHATLHQEDRRDPRGDPGRVILIAGIIATCPNERD